MTSSNILPAMFTTAILEMESLNFMKLDSPTSTILSALIFNANIIPLVMKGITYKLMSAVKILRRNLLVYGLGEVIAPFIGIKLIDLFVGVFV
jgi:potassium-transporting ATPase ATP-binding subunit